MDLDLLNLYETMVKIRLFDTKAEELFLQSKIPGFIHSYVGEEAIATGVSANLRPDDYITSTHRGHGHMIAKGADLKLMMAELYGKRTGYCKGKGGSMHIMDFSLGVLGANGVVGGGIPIAVGAGMAIKLIKKTDQVVVCYFGDGASNRGTFHEGLNWASIYKLPVIFVCENNMYASTAYMPETTSVLDISARASGYSIPGITVDGNDVLAVYEAAKEAIERARKGGGPTLIEAKTYRLKGHFVGDPELYRSKEEVQKFWEKEPIGRFERKLFEEGILSEEKKREIWTKIEKELEEAIRFAEESDFPPPEDALTDLFVDDRGYDY
ncbi:MAG: thiamine pyrophosphate-dependent dehydrogenase E1 component subunit alpha [Synergistetes bacterium]|nr:MAG: Acetoin dehydrogenase E1 component alpha subunit [bacterium 42_11]MBC7331466.1 thiamine pyrophosphate-dependent dehydrogenase E1 component subunit alpha [Synergistota bacterium]